ncbi:hypothetical protein E2542_SST16527 [Spatholobus suberectus]|nr:hypothetical protein E2542_SST16527 [Spatholobus suberectus]
MAVCGSEVVAMLLCGTLSCTAQPHRVSLPTIVCPTESVLDFILGPLSLTHKLKNKKGHQQGALSRKLTTNRGYCGHCKSIVWLNNSKCPNVHSGIPEIQDIKPVTAFQDDTKLWGPIIKTKVGRPLIVLLMLGIVD